MLSAEQNALITQTNRDVESGGYYWRVTQFLWPSYAFIPAFSWPKTCTYTVPVDDHARSPHTLAYGDTYPLTTNTVVEARNEPQDLPSPQSSTVDPALRSG